MTIDHDTSTEPEPTEWRPTFETHKDRMERHLQEADNLADSCSELIARMRDYPPLGPVTARLVDAHAMLVTAANTLAAIR